MKAGSVTMIEAAEHLHPDRIQVIESRCACPAVTSPTLRALTF